MEEEWCFFILYKYANKSILFFHSVIPDSLGLDSDCEISENKHSR